MSTPKCSIVIPVFNQIDYTLQCLEAIDKSQPDKSLYQIVVIDNASSDQTKDKLSNIAEQGEQIKYYRMKENLGFNLACNYGAERSDGEFIIFLNNDTIPQPGWMEALIESAMQTRVGIAGCKLVYPESYSINHAGYVYNAELGGFYHIYHRYPESFEGVNKVREYQALLGACIIIRKKFFSELGGFANYGLEDIDLCLKARERGKAVLFNPSGKVYHYGSITYLNSPTGSFPESDLIDFNLRWPKSKLISDDWRFYIEDGLLDNQNCNSTNNYITKSLDLFHKAQSFLKSGKRGDSLNALRESVNLFPLNLEASLELVCQLTESGYPEEAGELILRIIKVAPRCYEAYIHGRQIFLALKNKTKSDELLSKLDELEGVPEDIFIKAKAIFK